MKVCEVRSAPAGPIENEGLESTGERFMNGVRDLRASIKGGLSSAKESLSAAWQGTMHPTTPADFVTGGLVNPVFGAARVLWTAYRMDADMNNAAARGAVQAAQMEKGEISTTADHSGNDTSPVNKLQEKPEQGQCPLGGSIPVQGPYVGDEECSPPGQAPPKSQYLLRLPGSFVAEGPVR